MKKAKIKEKETLHFLLEQKISFVNMVGNVLMTWWVSSVVFCGTTLAAVWLNRKELVDSGVIGWLGFLLLVFFSSIVYFGILITQYIDKVSKEISVLGKELNSEFFFSYELSNFKRAIITGTTSFVLVLITWIILWIGLWLGLWIK